MFRKTLLLTIISIVVIAHALTIIPTARWGSTDSTTTTWFLVPMVYWDSMDSLTIYGGLGFGDTTKYVAAELRYAPDSKAMRGELTIDLPIFGEGTNVYAKYVDATTNDPRKPEVSKVIEEDSTVTITDVTEDIQELHVRFDQRYKAGIETLWGIYGDYRTGKYLSDYSLGEGSGWVEEPETTEATYVGGGITFGYDGRFGSLDPEAGYVFYIEVGAHYLLDDTSEADYSDITTETPKVVGSIFVEQYIYTPASALPVDIPLLTVQAPTTMAIRTTACYHTSKAPQVLAWKAGDFYLFRGVPQRELSGFAFYLLSLDFRIVPVTNLYTPASLLHFIAPHTIPDTRGDLEITPFVDIGKIFGAEDEKQFYSFGGGIAFRISKSLITRFDVVYCSTFSNFTTYFSIRHPF